MHVNTDEYCRFSEFHSCMISQKVHILSSYNRSQVHIYFYSLLSSPSSVSPTSKQTKLHTTLLPVKVSLGFTASICAQSLKCHCADGDHQGTVQTSSHTSLLTLWVKCVCLCFPSCLVLVYFCDLMFIHSCHLLSHWSSLRVLSWQKYT